MVDILKEGMDLTYLKQWMMIWALAFWGSSLSLAQAVDDNEDERDEIYLSVSVGYNTAYRDKSWVPVDALITNEQADLDGVLEVRTYDAGNNLQSPIFHLPINCPKDSVKRYQLMAYLDGASRLDARILENGRPAIDTPSFVQIIPVEQNDLMGMVLDDDPLNYSFLNPSLQKLNPNLRLHRFNLSTKDLVYFPKHIKTMETFNFVIIGSIDPSRITLTQRTLLREYVDGGGVIIILSGVSGNVYKGTWIEELSGVSMGVSEEMDEREAMELVFPIETRYQASNQIVLTTLVPRNDSVLSTSKERPLATQYVIGSGTIFTLAVDAKSHAFQDVGLYRKLWSEMMVATSYTRPLNFGLFAEASSQLIPNLSGVNIRSLGFVVLYLLLYVGVGIIGNWLFWNARKRREMAWVCLVVFSICFSAYAYVSGTSGWAKIAEKQQVDVVHMKPGVEQSSLYSLAGILTARTKNYTITQTLNDSLISDIRSRGQMNYYGQGAEQTPFVFMQGEESGIQRFTVGASELRFAALEGKINVSGNFEGKLVIDDDGVHGIFRNETPYVLTEYALLFEGALMPLTLSGEEIKINLKHSLIQNAYNRMLNEGDINQWRYYQNIGEHETFRKMRSALFVDDGDYTVSKGFPPMLIGWTDELVNNSLEVDHEVLDSLQKTYVVAEIFYTDTRSSSLSAIKETVLQTRFNNYQSGRRGGYYGQQPWEVRTVNRRNDLFNHAANLSGDRYISALTFEVRVEPWMHREAKSALELVLYVEDNNLYDLIVGYGAPKSDKWHEANIVSDEIVQLSKQKVRRIMYRIENWGSVRNKQGTSAMFHVLGKLKNESIQNQAVDIRYSVTATGKLNKKDNGQTGEWPQWQ